MTRSEIRSRLTITAEALLTAMVLHAVLVWSIAPVPPATSNAGKNPDRSVTLLPITPNLQRFLNQHDPRNFLRSDSPHGYLVEIPPSSEEPIRANPTIFQVWTPPPPSIPAFGKFDAKTEFLTGFSGNDLPLPFEFLPYTSAPRSAAAPEYGGMVFNEEDQPMGWKIPLPLPLPLLQEDRQEVRPTVLRRIIGNGGQEQLRLTESSGIPLLDRAALEAVSGLGTEAASHSLTVYWTLPEKISNRGATKEIHAPDGEKSVTRVSKTGGEVGAPPHSDAKEKKQ